MKTILLARSNRFLKHYHSKTVYVCNPDVAMFIMDNMGFTTIANDAHVFYIKDAELVKLSSAIPLTVYIL